MVRICLAGIAALLILMSASAHTNAAVLDFGGADVEHVRLVQTAEAIFSRHSVNDAGPVSRSLL